MSGENADQDSVAASAAASANTAPPLFLVRGDATPEEVAALTVVLQGMATAVAAAPEREVTPEWSAHHRKLRSSLHAGPGGWRSSGLPR